MFAQKRDQIGIIEIIILEKRNGRLGRLDIFRFIFYHFGICSRRLHSHILANNYIWTQKQRQPNDKTESHLSDYFKSPVQPLLIFFEHLNIVVQKTYGSQPNGRNQHQYHVDISQSPDQQTRYQYSDNNDNPTHRRRAFLGHLPFQPEITHELSDLQNLQFIDNTPADNGSNKQSQNKSDPRPERYIGKQSSPRKIE